MFVGPGNELGRPVPIERAADHVFGYCLLNDWSAQGIQFHESRPLGPFLGKSVMTTISPWVVIAEAPAPFSVPARRRPAVAQPPAHLVGANGQAEGGRGIDMFAEWTTPRMRESGEPPAGVVAASFRDSYWTPVQMLAHHASNGCNLEPGDLFGSGTVSGPRDDSRACLAEITGHGSGPIDIGGEERAWLEDSDEITFRARAGREGFAAIGFGECRGRIAPALPIRRN